MAINTQKFLPGSGGTQKALPQAKITTIQLTSQDKKNVNTIRVKTIQVDKILKGTLAADKKRIDDKKKAASQERRQKQESQLEKKPEKNKKFTMPKVLPRMGIWDWIKNFIGSIILGWFAYNMIEHADKLKGTLTTILNVTDFVIDWGGKLLNGIVTFIDWGFQAFDWAKGVATKFGLEGPFNAFIGAVDKLITLLVAIAAIRALTPDWAKGKGPKPKGQKPKGPKGKPRSWQNKRPRFPWQKPKVSTGTGGKPKFKIPGTGPKVSGGPKGLPKGIKIPGGKGGIVGMIMLIPTLFEAGGLISQGKWKTATNILLSTGAAMAAWSATMAGAGAAAAALTGVSFGLGSPAAIALLMGGVAAASVASMGAYSASTALLKKTGLHDEDKTGFSKGGVVKKKPVHIPKRKVYEVYPSAIDFPDEGEDDGKKGIWGKIKDSIVGAVKWITNPLGKVWRTMGDKFLKVKFFGPILTLAIKSLVGQKLSKKDYDDAGLGIASLLNKGLNDGDLTGNLMAAFAEGGLVSPLMQKKQKNVADWISKQLQESLNVLSLKTSNDIKAVESKDAEESKGSGGGSGGGQTNNQRLSGIVGGRLKLTAEDWEYIARTVQGEAGPGDDQYYVAAAIINRMSDPRWYGPNASAKTVVSASGQFAGYHEGAPINAAQHTRLTSDGGQEKILQALQHLEGRTDFKGTSMYHNMGSSDVRPNDRSNFYHYLEQKGKNDPLTPGMKRDYWKSLVSGGGGGLQWNPLGWLSGNKGEEIAQVASTGSTSGLLGGNEGESQGPGVRKRGKGSKLAGELGRFLDKRGLGGWGGGVHRHPEHPPWGKESGHRAGSLHYESQGGRAIDIGGWGPMRYKREGMSGTDDQTQIIAGIRAWERGKNISQRAEFAHEGNDSTGGHDDHVHVAYHKGGPVPGKGERWAKLLGGEMVIDVDSAGPAKNLLLAINQASGPEQVMKAIQDYAPYEALQSRMIPIPIPVPTGGSSASSSRPTTIVVGGGGGTHDQFESLVAQG